MSDFVVESRNKERKLQQKSLQMLLLSMTVPFKQGGGLVFPIGYPFAGYELAEWEFERYRAQLSQHLLSDAAALEIRRVRLAFYILLGLATVGTWALIYLKGHGTFGSTLYLWVPLLWLTPFLLLGLYTYVYTYRLYKMFERGFHGCPRVPRHAFFYRRSLGYLVGQSFSPARGTFAALMSALCGAYFLLLSMPSGLYGWMALGVLLLFIAAFKFAQCLFYWHFRATRGRPPTRENLQPVDPPAAALHSA